jgi:hypothetical protein
VPTPDRWNRHDRIMMEEFSDICIEQCDAARDIREAWGTKKALGDLAEPPAIERVNVLAAKLPQ